jgi:uncharacterized protein YcbK (DUF882 family)
MINKDPKNKIPEKLELLWKIGYALGIAFLIYTVVPMENRLTHRIDKLEESTQSDSKEQFERFFEYYNECKKDINDVRREYQRDIVTSINELKEELYAWFVRKDAKSKKAL